MLTQPWEAPLLSRGAASSQLIHIVSTHVAPCLPAHPCNAGVQFTITDPAAGLVGDGPAHGKLLAGLAAVPRCVPHAAMSAADTGSLPWQQPSETARPMRGPRAPAGASRLGTR